MLSRWPATSSAVSKREPLHCPGKDSLCCDGYALLRTPLGRISTEIPEEPDIPFCLSDKAMPEGGTKLTLR
jgi:hypothetical protein